MSAPFRNQITPFKCQRGGIGTCGELPRGEGLSLCSRAATCPSSRGAEFPNKHVWKEKGDKRENGRRRGTACRGLHERKLIELCSRGATEERRTKLTSERGVTAAAAAMTFAAPTIHIKVGAGCGALLCEPVTFAAAFAYLVFSGFARTCRSGA